MRSGARVVNAKSELTAETESWELFVRVIELKDIANGLKRLEILITTQILVVKRITVLWFAIAQSEINGYGKINFTAAENVFKERVSLLNTGVLEDKLAVLTFDYRQLKRLHVFFKVVDVE